MTLAVIPSHLPLPPPAKIANRYEWFSLDNFERGLTWAKSLQGPLDDETRRYMVTAIVDLVHFDRASRGASALPEPTKPIREADLETTIYKGGPHWMRDTGRYHLVRKPLVWGPDAPSAAVDAFAHLTALSPPDRCWIGEYVQEPRPQPLTHDPIIYAEYGEWLIEVARWI